MVKKFFSSLLTGFEPVPIQSKIIHVKGEDAESNTPAKFDHILVVDDLERHTKNALENIKSHFHSNELTVYIAHTNLAALDFFKKYDIKLVICDLDLQDENGNGAKLIQEFRQIKPNVIILANSGKKRFNDMLIKAGADHIIGKSNHLFLKWLRINGR